MYVTGADKKHFYLCLFKRKIKVILRELKSTFLPRFKWLSGINSCLLGRLETPILSPIQEFGTPLLITVYQNENGLSCRYTVYTDELIGAD